MQDDLGRTKEYRDNVENRLKERGLYFYEGEGSVFADYKILRTKALREIGESLGEEDPERAVEQGSEYLRNQCSLDMPTDELLA